MNWLGVVGVAIGGACGSVVRYGVGRLLGWCLPESSSILATGIVNLVGAFLLGVVVTLFQASPKPNGWVLLLGVGFCGGMTTFSTLAMELADLMHAKRFWGMAGYGIGSMVIGILAFLVGVWVSSRS
ncbi:MAG: fluoride efflux transporter FluC [Pirellula sp.]